MSSKEKEIAVVRAEQAAASKEIADKRRAAVEADSSVKELDLELEQLRAQLKAVEDLKSGQLQIVDARKDQEAHLRHDRMELQELLAKAQGELAQLKQEAALLRTSIATKMEAQQELSQQLLDTQHIVRVSSRLAFVCSCSSCLVVVVVVESVSRRGSCLPRALRVTG